MQNNNYTSKHYYFMTSSFVSISALKHDGVKCAACSASEFPGTRWKCSSCKDYDLCTLCYFKDKHDTGHLFERIDAPGLKGSGLSLINL